MARTNLREGIASLAVAPSGRIYAAARAARRDSAGDPRPLVSYALIGTPITPDSGAFDSGTDATAPDGSTPDASDGDAGDCPPDDHLKLGCSTAPNDAYPGWSLLPLAGVIAAFVRRRDRRTIRR
jgi:MYXO-CTERM domain-containing protein